MLLFSTVLFVDGNPVGYHVYKEDDRLALHPAENPNRHIHPPTLSAQNTEGNWIVQGTQNRDLIDQVIEDVTLSGGLARFRQSAAP